MAGNRFGERGGNDGRSGLLILDGFLEGGHSGGALLSSSIFGVMGGLLAFYFIFLLRLKAKAKPGISHSSSHEAWDCRPYFFNTGRCARAVPVVRPAPRERRGLCRKIKDDDARRLMRTEVAYAGFALAFISGGK